MPSCQVMLPMSDGFDDRLRFFLNGGVALLRALQGSGEECDSTAAIATSEASVSSSKGKFSSTALTAEFSISVLICSNAALASDDTGKNNKQTSRVLAGELSHQMVKVGLAAAVGAAGQVVYFHFLFYAQGYAVLKSRTSICQVDDTLETSHIIRHSKWDAGKLVQGSVCFKSRIQFFIVRYRDLMIGAFCAFHPLRQRLVLSTEKCLALLRHLPVVSALRFG
ncbi:hypothetical protein T4B_15400 [Trichinella pseudospiralis]|uniref:Uncharacterized protein n=1 Tax=Trichinella pseudospiralis TaxID=6337 RepID=A0A0V1J4K7_TRIPS|nr:hypothetical protein T4B_15400 [Trichinella pseudospiralis]